MKPRNLWMLFVVGSFVAGSLAGCGDDGPGSNGNGDQFPCNYDGVCDPGEDRLWCPDCEFECDLNEGDEYDYIVSEIILPKSASDNIGVDMTGDGNINNKLGALLGVVPEGDTDPNEMIAQAIQDGSVILLGRLVVSDWSADESMAVQVFQGTSDATEQLFDIGNNHASIADGFDRDLHLCGQLIQGYVEAGPSDLTISIAFGDILLDLPLSSAQVIAMEHPMTPDSWTDVMIGGGLSKDTINNIVIPEVVKWLNEATLEDPEGGIGEFVINSLDGDCSPVPEGCEDVVPGEGECSYWDPATEPDGPVITETEIRCSNLFATALRPDVDSDGDGVRDLVSLGVMVSAVSITIDN